MKNTNQIFYMILGAVIILTLLKVLRTSPEVVFDMGQPILEEQGYTHIESTGEGFFCCGKYDDSCGFTAYNAKGEYVEGCFCERNGNIQISF